MNKRQQTPVRFSPEKAKVSPDKAKDKHGPKFITPYQNPNKLLGHVSYNSRTKQAWNETNHEPVIPQVDVFQFHQTVQKPKISHSPNKSTFIKNVYNQATPSQPFKKRPHSGIQLRLTQYQKDQALVIRQENSKESCRDYIGVREIYSRKQRRDIQKIMPNEIYQSKEDLYEKLLAAQMKINSLNEENRNQKTRLQFMENQIQQQDQTGQVVAFTREFRELKNQHAILQHDYEDLVREMQSTSVKELKAEIEVLTAEARRLKTMVSNNSSAQDDGKLLAKVQNLQEQNKQLQLSTMNEKNKSRQKETEAENLKVQLNALKAELETAQNEAKQQKKSFESQERQKFVIESQIASVKQSLEQEILMQKQEAQQNVLQLQTQLQEKNKKIEEQQLKFTQELEQSQNTFDTMRKINQKNLQAFKDQIKDLEQRLQNEKDKNNEIEEHYKKQIEEINKNRFKELRYSETFDRGSSIQLRKSQSHLSSPRKSTDQRFSQQHSASQNSTKKIKILKVDKPVEIEKLTVESAPITDALITLKRALQINQLKFEHIDRWLFGDEYKSENRYTLAQLSELLSCRLHMQKLQANIFAQFLVQQCTQRQTYDDQSKVLACKVVTVLISCINDKCNGLQLYNDQKVKKMQLIIGEKLLQQNIDAADFDQFGMTLRQIGLGRETLDCVHIHLLKLSESYQRVNSSVLQAFLEQCKSQAMSYSSTGMTFPVEEELLEYSLTEDSQGPNDEIVDQHILNEPVLQKYESVLKKGENLVDKKVFVVPDNEPENFNPEQSLLDNQKDQKQLQNDSQATQQQQQLPQMSELDIAIVENSFEKIKKLLQNKNVSDQEVLFATINLSENTKLLQQVANIVGLDFCDEFGRSPFHLCLTKPKMLQTLFQQQIENPDAFNLDGYTPLMLAVKMGKVESVKICLDGNCCPFLTNDQQENVISIALKSPNSQSIVELVQNSMQQWITDHGSEQIQMIVSQRKHIKLGPQNLKRSVSIKATNLFQNADFEQFKKLIENNYPCEDALIKVCKLSNHIQFLQYLMDFDFDFNYTDSKGMSGLHYVCSQGKTQYAKTLLEQQDIDQNLFDSHGWTPLMHAVKSECIETVMVCLNHACNPLLQNADGDCALQIAKKLPHQDIQNLITIVLEQAINQWLSNLPPIAIAAAHKVFNRQHDHQEMVESIQSDDFLHFKHLIEGHYPCEDAFVKVCKYGINSSFIKYLFENFKFDVNYPDSKGKSALHHACALGKTEFVALIFEHEGVDQDHFDGLGWTPLMHAVKSECIESVVVCLNHACNPLLQNADGDSALTIAHNLEHEDKMHAISAYIEEAIKEWLRNFTAQAIIGSIKKFKKQHDHKEIIDTIKNNDFEHFKHLIDGHYPCEDALVRICSFGGDISFINYLLDNFEFDINYADSKGKTALHHACANGKTQFAKTLLEQQNIDQNLFDGLGWTPLMHAVNSECIELVVLCLNHACNPLLQNADGNCALRIACNSAHEDIQNVITILLEQAVKEWLTNLPVEAIAAAHKVFDKQHDHQEIADSIKDNDLEHFMHLIDGHYPCEDALMKVCQNGQNPIFVKFLLQNFKFDVNYADSKGKSALHHACALGKTEFVALIFEHEGVDQDHFDGLGWTPLMHAVKSECIESVVVCLNHACNPLLQNVDGDSALTIAHNLEHEDKMHAISAYIEEAIKEWLRNFTAQAIIGSIKKFKKQHDHKEIIDTIKNNDFEHFKHLIDGHYPLEDAAIRVCKYSKKLEFINYLFGKSKFDVNSADKNKRTGLHISCRQGKHEFVSLLLQHEGIRKDDFDSKGYNPLMYSVLSKCIKTVYECTKYGCNPLPLNEANESCLTLAEKIQNEDILKQIQFAIQDWEHKQAHKSYHVSMANQIDVIDDSNHQKPIGSPGHSILRQKKVTNSHKEEMIDFINQNDTEQVLQLIGRGYPITEAFFQICKNEKDLAFMLREVAQKLEDINVQDVSGRSGAHYCAENGNLEKLKILLEHLQAKINVRDKHDDTPLMFSVLSEKVEVVQLCLRHLANPFYKNKADETAYDLVRYVDPSIRDQIQSLIKTHISQWLGEFNNDFGLIKNLTLQDSDAVLALPTEEKVDFELRDFLIFAIQNQEVEKICDIIDLKIFKIEEILQLVCQHGEDTTELIKLILINDPIIDINYQDANGRTALHFACLGGKFNVLEFLLQDKNLERNLYDNCGETPLMCAVKSQNKLAVLICLQNFCNPLHMNYEGETILDYINHYNRDGSAQTKVFNAFITSSYEQWIDRLMQHEGLVLANKLQPKVQTNYD